MYPITMSFTVSNEEQLAKLVAAAAPTLPAVATTATSPCQGHAKETEKAEKAKPEAKKPETAVASTAQPAATATATQEPTGAPAGGKTIDDAKALTMKIVADKGRDAAVALLGKYGVPVAAKLKPEQVEAFCADAEKVLAS